MANGHFYDHMTGELTDLGRKYGFPKDGRKNPEQYAQAIQRYNNSLDAVHEIYHHESPNNDSFGGKYEIIDDNEAMIEERSDDFGGKYEILAEDAMYDMATSQCHALRPALQHPECNEKTREAIIFIIKNILNSFQDTNEIKKRKEQIFLENPDFFPMEADLINTKNQLRPRLENLKQEIQQRHSRSIRPQDRISGVVAGDRLVEGVERGFIDQPKDTRTANRQAEQIRKRLGLMLEKKRNIF